MNRNPYIYLEVAAFILFLCLGFWVGDHLNPELPARVHTSSLKPTPSPIPALPDGERILLLASVDILDSSEPQLKSLWLLTYYLNDQPIQLLPIYPNKTNTQQPNQSHVMETFSVVKENGVVHIAPTFIKQLSEHDFWLSGYVLMDDHATSAIINLIGGLPTESGLQSGEQIISTIPPSADKPNYAHDQQALLLSQFCLTLSQMTTSPQWSTILELIPDHMVSDIHPLRLLTEIRLLTLNQTQLRCEFPALTYTP